MTTPLRTFTAGHPVGFELSADGLSNAAVIIEAVPPAAAGEQ